MWTQELNGHLLRVEYRPGPAIGPWHAEIRDPAGQVRAAPFADERSAIEWCRWIAEKRGQTQERRRSAGARRWTGPRPIATVDMASVEAALRVAEHVLSRDVPPETERLRAVVERAIETEGARGSAAEVMKLAERFTAFARTVLEKNRQARPKQLA